MTTTETAQCFTLADLVLIAPRDVRRGDDLLMGGELHRVTRVHYNASQRAYVATTKRGNFTLFCACGDVMARRDVATSKAGR